MLRISEFILNFVLNAGWQVTAISVIAALASWLLRNGPARYRHALWMIALVASLVVPLLTSTRVVREWASSFQVVSSPSNPPAVQHSSAPELTVDHTRSQRRATVTTTPRSVLLLALGYVVFIVLGRRSHSLLKRVCRTRLARCAR